MSATSYSKIRSRSLVLMKSCNISTLVGDVDAFILMLANLDICIGWGCRYGWGDFLLVITVRLYGILRGRAPCTAY
jgi:hypothetical protein